MSVSRLKAGDAVKCDGVVPVNDEDKEEANENVEFGFSKEGIIDDIDGEDWNEE